MLFNNRKQDGVIFVGTSNKPEELLEKLALRVPGMFRSNCPVIMPNIYSTIMEMKLDSHVILYENEGDEMYRLLDKFSVKGGAPIILELGTWEKCHGVILKKTLNRWDRRTDLLGATFINAVQNSGTFGTAIYNNNGTAIASVGWFQDIFFYINRVNMTVTTVGLQKEDNCWYLVDRKMADVCTGDMIHNVDAFGHLPISIARQTETLLAGAHTGTALDAWVFIEVFGGWQWLVILSTLLVIAILWPMLHIALERNNKTPPLYEGLVMVSLFAIQNGKPLDSRFWARRLLALTTSMMTLLVFVYYCNDITSKMTAGPPPLNVRSFDDALDQGYEVIVVDKYNWQLLKDSKNGTSKHAMYKHYFEQYENDILEYDRWKSGQTPEEIKAGKEYDKIDNVPKWFFESDQSIYWATEKISQEKKILWYDAESIQRNYKGKVYSLNMDASHYTYIGFALQRDSEFLSIFNHYLLKAYESGILNRLDLFHNDQPDIKIGLNEPEPLGMNNLMFPFSFLAGSAVLSATIAVIEKLLKKRSSIISKTKSKMTFLM